MHEQREINHGMLNRPSAPRCKDRVWCASASWRSKLDGSHMLIDEDRVTVRINCDKTGRPDGTLICLADELHVLLF